MQSNDTNTLTSAQIRAGRALVRWSADDLAEKARIGIATLRRAEGNDGILNMTLANQDAIRAALERAGVEFIAVDETSPGAGAGVRLKVRNV